MNLVSADRRERAMEHYRRALQENPDVVTRRNIEGRIRDIEEAERHDEGRG